MRVPGLRSPRGSPVGRIGRRTQRKASGSRTRGLWLLALALTPVAPVACGAQEQVSFTDAEAAFREGRYDEAIRAYRGLVSQVGPAARAGLAKALIRTGAYEEAAEVARGDGSAPVVQRWLGQALLEMGRLDEAEAAFAAAASGRDAGWLTSELRLGEIELRRGQTEAALDRFDRFIDVYNGGVSLTAEDLLAVGTAVKYLGVRDSNLFHDARRAYDEAAALDPTSPEPQVHLGTLFLEVYQAGDATTHFTRALAIDPNHPGARMGMAETLRFNSASGISDEVEAALDANPNYVPALVFSASSRVESEDLDGARELAEEALAVDPTSLEARTVLAATHFLRGEDADFGRLETAILADNPAYAAFYAEIADLAVRNRLYREAADLAREGLARSPNDARVQGLLGINQLRIGAIQEGTDNLEAAFERDPFNVWFFNTLKLLDTFERYEVIPTDNFRLVLDERESDLLAVYFEHIAEEALATLSERYEYTPPVPIRLEVFPDHADFSVRTVGLAGLGALGVSFGSVLAMDSPSAREDGSFNWASTLWHEVAHSVHLGLSRHRVPRWFTEGLAVWEQRRYRPGWGHGATPAFVAAYREGRLNPASRLNDGFVRPDFPEQVVFSYYQASLLLEMVEESRGFDAILAFLRGYGEGRSTSDLIESVLGMEPEALDREFDRYVRDRLAAPLASTTEVFLDSPMEALDSENPTSFFAQLSIGRERFRAGDLEGAEPFLRRAAELFPEYGGPDSPYYFLGRIERSRGNLDGAATELERLMTVSESHKPGAEELAAVYAEASDDAGAARALERLIEIAPFVPESHVSLSEAYERMERWSDAALERAALVALNPVDRAGALYELARTLHLAGQNDEARTAVLEALEIAPGYDEALELLLELRRSGGDA